MKCAVAAFLLMVLPVIGNAAPSPEIIEPIRHSFVNGLENEETAHDLHDRLEQIADDDPLLLAYFGATKALKAHHTRNYFSKYVYARNAVNMLNDAVEKAPENIEIRFLRYNVQREIPRYLGLSSNLDEDKNFIIENFLKDHHMQRDPKAMQTVAVYMVDSAGVEGDNKEPFEEYLP